MSRIVLFYMLIVWNIPVFSEQQFNLYNTGDDQQDRYCLLYYVRDDLRDFFLPKEYVLTHQIISYCLRSSEEDVVSINISDPIDPSFNFEELRDQNISTEQLLSWSASIDFAEEYQLFLTNTSHWSSSEKNLSFYNCTLPWFGPLCAFAFDPLSDRSLDEIVVFNFEFKPRVTSGNKVTCYKHIDCKTSLVCLDWREICDRKADCLDGADEFNCWQLEINECAENEYRCHNGLCVFEEFFHDGTYSPDCLDSTDDIDAIYIAGCDSEPAFRCEERTCRPGLENFPCGDGNCIDEKRDFCINGRNNPLLNDNCSRAMTCLIFPRALDQDTNWCQTFCSNENCAQVYCPTSYEFSFGSNILGHVRLIFNTTKLKAPSCSILLPDYLCYNENICVDFLPATIHLNGSTCRHWHEFKLEGISCSNDFYIFSVLMNSVKDIFRGCLIVPNEISHCNYSTMYQCQNSTKCISKHRLADRIQDCPWNDDETFEYSCSLNDARLRSICTIQNKKICIAPFIDIDRTTGCDEKPDDMTIGSDAYDDDIYFQRICDGKPDLMVIIINEQNETDETKCEKWPCNNTYTRCDGFWSCEDGADEINCPNSVCPEFHHSCIFPNDPTNLSCLPMNRSGDGIVDCLGATDERKECRVSSLSSVIYSWQCLNHTMCIHPTRLCAYGQNCPLGDDEQFCTYRKSMDYATCGYADVWTSTPNEKFFCNFLVSGSKRSPIPFLKLSNIPTYPEHSTVDNESVLSLPETELRAIQMIETEYVDLWRCNRGLPIYIRTKNNTKELHCFCPPSYYGNTCQYQNQRVSLTLRIQATSDWLYMWTFVLTLVDDEEKIQSHDHIEYLSVRDCKTKFNVYLLYSTRPKNSTKNYSVRIHVFNQLTLKYRASWFFPIQFPFLPVYRLAVQLTIPFVDNQPLTKCISPCIHGRCFNNVNDPSATFCLCESGWSGIQCDTPYTCDCASKSLCFGASLCICSIGRFGPRCHFLQSSCSLEICTNHGHCILSDHRYTQNKVNKPTCICSDGYFGDHCEFRQTRIDVSFHPESSIPSSVIVHMIKVRKDEKHIRTTLLKQLAVDQNSVSFYTLLTFHIALVEIFCNTYYLIILHEKEIISANISTEILPSHRCLSIHELFDPIHANQHLLKRIKHYQIPCKQRSDLVCFYDDVYICLCTLDQQANCFEFNHNITYDCHGHNYCENGGQCFRDDSECPKSSTCGCPDCYFGSRCQFSTKGSSLSLDMILGYYIKPNIQFSRQSTIIKFGVALTTSIFSLGVISNLLTFFTFRMQITRKTGCALYLLASSIISTLAMIILTIKFGLLLASHMGVIRSRSLVYIQCLCTDFLIRFLLSTNDWLGACVAIDRVANVAKGIHFDRTKSKQLAKYIIPILFVVNALTHIHDPIYRRLIDDDDEQRTWCIVKYSSFSHIFDWVINVLHFSFPFAINSISAFIIIIFSARARSIAQKNQPYKQLLRDQFQLHKHLFISPCILVLLALPRLIISFLSECMKSARNPWLYLSGYFISFVPPMLTFIIFVLPSKTYREQLMESIKHLRSK